MSIFEIKCSSLSIIVSSFQQMKKYKNKSMKTHAKLSYMSRCYAALKVNQHFNHETKNDFFEELEPSIAKKIVFFDTMPVRPH